MKRFLYVITLMFVMCLAASAQVSNNSATPVQQTATMLNAATKVSVGQASAGSQSTATLTPSGGNSVYITGMLLEGCSTGSATTATANVNFTSTNLTGAPVWSLSFPTTANTCQFLPPLQFATPLKATTPGTAVTIVSPAGLAQMQYTAIVFWYEGQ